MVTEFLVDVLLIGALLDISVLDLIQFVCCRQLVYAHIFDILLRFRQLGIYTVQLVLREELERLQRGELGAELLVHVHLHFELLVKVVYLLLQVPVRHNWSEVHLETDLTLLGLLLGDELVHLVHLLRLLHNCRRLITASRDIKLPIACLLNGASRVGLGPAKVAVLAEQVVLDHEVPRDVVLVSQLGSAS